jgi:hypothetical protein
VRESKLLLVLLLLTLLLLTSLLLILLFLILFLKEIIESAPRIVHAISRACAAAPPTAGGLALHRNLAGKKLAGICGIFARYTRGNQLAALKSRRGIELRTLLAGVQRRSTFGTTARAITRGRQNRAALGTSRNASFPRHVHCPRTIAVHPGRGRLLFL